MATRDYTDEGAEITPRPRTLTTKVVAAAKEAARKGGEDVASAMRYLAPRNAQTFPESPAGSQA
jgi:hypothetical protein